MLDIKHLAQVESSREELLRGLFDRLNRDPESPLAGKLSATKSLAGKISRVTFNRAVSPVVSSGVFQDADADSQYRLLLNYLKALDAELTDKRLLLRAGFYEAALSVFDEVVRTALASSGTAKVEALRQTIEPLARLNYHGTGGRALQNWKDIASLMRAALRKTVAISGDML